MRKIFTLLLLFCCVLTFFNKGYAQNRTALQSLIDECNSKLQYAEEGTNDGQYLIGSKDELKNSVKDATDLLLNNTASENDLENGVVSLFKSYTKFTKQRFGIVNPDYSDNYWQISGDPASWKHYNTHDPSIIFAEGWWYSFSTDAAWGYTSKGIPVKRSRDLVNWEAKGWAFNGYPTEAINWGKQIRAGNVMNGIWAPYIMKTENEYRLYYCAVFESGDAAIILATSNQIEGPWVQKGVVHSTLSGSEFNAIDPTVSVDSEGKHWMIYGSWHQGIAYIELDPATGLKKTGSTPKRISRNRVGSGWSNATEAPEIIYHPGLKKYYLFLAQGDLGTVYHTRVARADHPTGPWLDYSGNSIDYTSKKDIYPLLAYPYQFKNHPGWQGIAHSAAITDGNDFYLVNQGRPTILPTMMVMHVRKIYWTADGWPVLSPERYTNPGIMPKITESDIPGTWERIKQEEWKSGGIAVDVPSAGTSDYTYICPSQLITFNETGEISTGEKWALSNDTLLITSGNTTIKYFLDWEWDWENHCPTLIYTGLSKEGRAIWGKKVTQKSHSNIIMNGNFDADLKYWTISKYGGNFDVNVASSGINGNTLSVKCTQPSQNYWDQQISWLFPVPKAARYRVSFKAKASKDNISANFEIQDQATIIPVIRTGFTVGTTEKTYEFITNDIVQACGIYTMNIQYGNMEAGSQLWINDIALEDITDQWTGNYITNGNFSDRLNGWKITTSSNSSIALKEESSAFLNFYQKITSNEWNTSGITWNVHLYEGFNYVFQFTGQSDNNMKASPRLLKSSAEIKSFDPVEIASSETKYKFVIPEIQQGGTYSMQLNFGLSGNETSADISNLSLIACKDGNCDETSIKKITNNVINNKVNVYPNPTTSYIYLSSEEEMLNVVIYNLNGSICKKTNISGVNNIINVDDIPAGTYILKVVTQNSESQQVIIIIRK